MSVVASRYSDAIFEIAVEEDCLEEMYESYQTVISVFSENADLINILSHPEIDINEKISLLKESFSEINNNLVNFMCVLVEKNRTREILNIFKDFEALYNIHNNIIVANVYSVEKLTKIQILSLQEKLNMKFDKKIHINNIIDKSLIGGIKIMIDNHVIDYSLKTKIDNLSDELHKIQIR